MVIGALLTAATYDVIPDVLSAALAIVMFMIPAE